MNVMARIFSSSPGTPNRRTLGRASIAVQPSMIVPDVLDRLASLGHKRAYGFRKQLLDHHDEKISTYPPTDRSCAS